VNSDSVVVFLPEPMAAKLPEPPVTKRQSTKQLLID
jgi:hypothetical protein